MIRSALASIIILSIILPAYAQEETAPAGHYLWLPHKMVEGNDYDALIVLMKPPSSTTTALISTSDPSVLEVPDSVTIEPYTNHGILRVKALKSGEAKVFAGIQGELASTDIEVFSLLQNASNLKIILASNSTKADRLTGYVFAIDNNGTPAPVQSDATIHMSSSGSVEVPQRIVITEGSYYSKFTAIVKGMGKIFASSTGMDTDEASVKKEKEDVEVRVAIAPDVALENSQAFYYVWLEKDNSPYVPPFTVNLSVSSDNPKVAFFTRGALVPDFRDAATSLTMINGVARGFLFTGQRGNATITASVGGFGSSSISLDVGPDVTRTVTATFGNETQVKDLSTDSSATFTFAPTLPSGDPVMLTAAVDDSDPFTINTIFVGQRSSVSAPLPEGTKALKAWLFPTLTTISNGAYAIAAPYQVGDSTATNTAGIWNGTLATVKLDINIDTPIELGSGQQVQVSSNGLDHQSMHVFKEGITRNHAIEFNVGATNEGNYTLFVSGSGLKHSKAPLTVKQAFRESYQLKIQPLLVRSGEEQDIAIVSIADSSGSLLDTEQALSEQLDIRIFSTNAEVNETGQISITNSAIIRGTVSAKTILAVSAMGMGARSIEIEPAGAPSSVELDVPEIAHVKERIPFALHAVDAFGVPLNKITASGFTSSSEISREGDYFVAKTEGIGKIAVMAASGAMQKSIIVFANRINFSIEPEKQNVKVGESIKVRIAADVGGLDITIDSPLSFKKDDDDDNTTYILTPDREGEFEAVFTAFRDGYNTASDSVRFVVQKFVNLMINAVSTDGSSISIAANLIKGNTSKTITVPYTEEIRPQQVSIMLPKVHKVGDKDYVLTKVFTRNMEFPEGNITLILNDNTEINVLYEQMLRVSVENGDGSNFYPYGSAITIRAGEKDKIPFLVGEVFDHWEGGLAGYNTKEVMLAVTDDINARAVLRDDYTGMMMIVAGASGFIMYKLMIRRGISITWFMIKARDKILHLLHRSRKK